ncbi:MAG: hypothetical protein ACJAZ3_001002 [Sphingobacteriales bacterium]|jgi:hypothetical protein
MHHGYCYFWRPEILWTHVLSDLLIVLAYLSIPITLVYLIKKNRDISFRWVFIAFGLFIIMCGLTHILGIITVWYPIYMFEGGMKAITAVVSVITAMGLIKIIPDILANPSTKMLQDANEKLQLEVNRRREMNTKLESITQELFTSN